MLLKSNELFTLLIITLFSSFSVAELKSIESGNLEQYTAQSGLDISVKKQTQKVRLNLSTSITREDGEELNFTSNKEAQRECHVTNWKCEGGTFPECWNKQAKGIYYLVGSIYNDGKIPYENIASKFTLLPSGKLSEVHVFGLENNQVLEQEFINSLRGMEFVVSSIAMPIKMKLNMAIYIAGNKLVASEEQDTLDSTPKCII